MEKVSLDVNPLKNSMIILLALELILTFFVGMDNPQALLTASFVNIAWFTGYTIKEMRPANQKKQP